MSRTSDTAASDGPRAGAGRGRPSVTRLAWRAARAGLAIALAPDRDRIAARVRVDEHWRRHELDGRAPRLTSRETIRATRPVGRWRQVEPLVPYDGWRRPWAWAGFGLWAGVAGAMGFLGWKTGRGPLGGLGHLHEFGAALPGPSADGDRVDDDWSAGARWSQGQRWSEGDGGLDDGGFVDGGAVDGGLADGRLADGGLVDGHPGDRTEGPPSHTGRRAAGRWSD